MESVSARIAGRGNTNAHDIACHPPSTRDNPAPSAVPRPHMTIAASINRSPTGEAVPPLREGKAYDHAQGDDDQGRKIASCRAPFAKQK
ncbi:hypothetical protein ASG25_09910 [Rhizobium sp. Leaf384]|nr:hypothetical protein ASG25_09910 [Rhizobium sp. Leaf384]KQS82550.1 hypothetical protein ASG58_04110 [Rhizobium sp. Leaf383]